jgi:hypothetical protein
MKLTDAIEASIAPCQQLSFASEEVPVFRLANPAASRPPRGAMLSGYVMRASDKLIRAILVLADSWFACRPLGFMAK